MNEEYEGDETGIYKPFDFYSILKTYNDSGEIKRRFYRTPEQMNNKINKYLLHNQSIKYETKYMNIRLKYRYYSSMKEEEEEYIKQLNSKEKIFDYRPKYIKKKKCDLWKKQVKYYFFIGSILLFIVFIQFNSLYLH